MLDNEVVTAVHRKQFNIWAVKHIDEGLEILTGIPAGDAGKTEGQSETVHGRVNEKLNKWSRLNRSSRTKPQMDARVKKRNKG